MLPRALNAIPRGCDPARAVVWRNRDDGGELRTRFCGCVFVSRGRGLRVCWLLVALRGGLIRCIVCKLWAYDCGRVAFGSGTVFVLLGAS